MVPKKVMDVIERHQYHHFTQHSAHLINREAQNAVPGPYLIDIDLYTGKVNVNFTFNSNDDYVMWMLKYS